MDWDDFAQGLGVLERFYEKSLDTEATKAWYQAVSARFTAEQWHEAVGRAVTVFRFFPTVDDLAALLWGTPEERARKEWQNREWTDVGFKAYQAVGGWPAYRSSERPELLLKEFIQAYVAELRAAGGVARPLPRAVPNQQPPLPPRQIEVPALLGLYWRWRTARTYSPARAQHYEAIAKSLGVTWEELERQYGGQYG